MTVHVWLVPNMNGLFVFYCLSAVNVDWDTAQVSPMGIEHIVHGVHCGGKGSKKGLKVVFQCNKPCYITAK